MSDTAKTRSQEVAADMAAHFRARTPLIWIVSKEEARVERYLCAAAEATKYEVMTWDIATGFADIKGDALEGESTQDIADALRLIDQRARAGGDAKRGLWIMRDLPPHLSGFPGISPLRQLRNLARFLPFADPAQVIVVLAPGGDVPPELANHATVIEWPLPDKTEIGEALDEAVAAQQGRCEPLNGKREAAIDAAVGLSEEEALACFGRSIVQLKRVDPVLVAKEKRRVISRERLLEWYDPLPGGLDAVGGLEEVKRWLMSRTSAFSPEARAYGLPFPKGLFLTGISGCGKTHIAKATATAFQCPLLRMDMGALKSKFVGESEGNIRRVQRVIEAIGKCVVLLDEVEKMMQGATSGSSDGGTSADQLGAMLTWMQERTSQAFIIATSNDVTALPPEFSRKGRFDELFFVDLPTRKERAQIVQASLKSFGRDSSVVDSFAVADATEGFTGAEIAALVPEAMFAAFNDKQRPVVTEDLVAVAAEIVPLSKTAAPKIEALRAWAKGKARPAGLPEEKTTEKRIRALDI